jgi:polyisoprenoid-binding protein YceI
MKSKLRSLVSIAALSLVAAATPALAAGEKFIIDSNHTNVGFSVRHFFTPVKGEFKVVEGTILYDKDAPANSKVEATIPATSINTHHERRDNHLRSADFFDVENNPTITFKSTAVTIDPKPNKGTMTGDLTMRGVTKPVSLDIEVLGVMATGGTGSVAGFSARGKVNRKDFGINWNRVLDQGGTMLADDVELILDVEAKTPQPEKAAAPAAAEAVRK